MTDKLKLGEFCAGTGAFSYAFEKTGLVKTEYSNDFDKNSEIIYNENFDTKMDCKDIHDIEINDLPNLDVITSGFPCQPYSIAGKQEGLNDERSDVFFKLVQIIKKIKPKVVIFENVKNLCSHDKGNTFKVISKEIDKLGYYYKYKILNTSLVSEIPQNRERIYIVCFKNKKYCDRFEFPDDIADSKKKQLKEFIDNNVDTKYNYSDRFKVWDEVSSNVTKDISTNTIYQYRRYYIRENKNSQCPTLTANMGGGGHNVPILKNKKIIRKLTPRECFNLQGFPKTYKLPDKISDSGLYKLAGNAVTVPVVEKLAKSVLKAMKYKTKVKKHRQKNNNVVNVDV